MEIGVDIVELERIERAHNRYGRKFLEKFMTQPEIELCLAKPSPVASIAGRFAAKEAVVKALGTGISGGVFWKSFEVLNDSRGRPVVTLLDKACFPRVVLSKFPSPTTATQPLQQPSSNTKLGDVVEYRE